MRHARIPWKSVLVAGLIACSDDPAAPREEPAPDLAAGITGTLASESDRHQHAVRLAADTPFELRLASMGGPIRAEVRDSAGTLLVTATTSAAGFEVSTWFRPATECACRVEVAPVPAYAGPLPVRYTVRLGPPGTPEHVAADIPVGARIEGESLGPAPDTDYFRLHGRAGDEIVVLLYGVDLPAGNLVVGHPESDTALLEIGTAFDTGLAWKRVRLPRNTVPLWLYTRTWGSDRRSAPYALETYVVNRAPETRPGTLPDAIATGETLERPGDIDEFTIATTSGEHFTLDFVTYARGNATAGMDLIDANGDRVEGTDGESYGPDAMRSYVSDYLRPTGETYRMRVHAETQGSEPLPYEALLTRIATAPERVPPVLPATGRTTQETLDGPADIDDFILRVGADRPVIRLVAEAPVDTGEIRIELTLPEIGVPQPQGMIVEGDTTEELLGGIREPGDVAVRVIACGSHSRRYRGEYALLTGAASSAPEDASARLPIGITVTESVAFLADRDEFVIDVDPARMAIEVVLETLGTEDGEPVILTVHRGVPSSGVFYGEAPSGSGDEPLRTGRLRLPTGGAWIVEVNAGRMAREWTDTRQYRLTVRYAD